jgi:hypothetical protein
MAAVVADTSPLIALLQIGHLSILKSLFIEVQIPPAVAREATPSLPECPSWLLVRELTKPVGSDKRRGGARGIDVHREPTCGPPVIAWPVTAETVSGCMRPGHHRLDVTAVLGAVKCSPHDERSARARARVRFDPACRGAFGH